ncbi:MAG: hypothetical protein IT370_19200 [Deltaproteobacteria bacterium]|nr:hypothetical protein [Deltaproteobacteria bacterium]
MNSTLIGIVLEAAAFLELSPDDVVAPDAAVAQLEDMTANLHALPAAELDQVVAYIRGRAASDPDPARRAFFSSFADGLEA